MADNDMAIVVKDVSKTFRLPHQKRTSIKSMFTSMFRPTAYEKQQVLNDISFDIKKGEFFGVVGRNGSGKSTLLKILAGIYTPSKGHVKIDGKLVAFIELGVGFNPDLTGKENVYLNCALIGFDRKEIAAMYDDIVAFAELDRFMDQQLKNYSSGMQVRLAFSIAIRAHGDILLLDEVLAVGDSAFQKKCLNYFMQLKLENKTVILVTHDMASVEKFCDRAMLIEDGIIKSIGSKDKIANDYEEMFIKEEMAKFEVENQHITTDKLVIDVAMLQDGKKTEDIVSPREYQVQLSITAKEAVRNGMARFIIKNGNGQVVTAVDSDDINAEINLDVGETQNLCFNIQNILTNGMYIISLSCIQFEKNRTVEIPIYGKRTVFGFQVRGIKKYKDSLTHPVITKGVLKK